MHGTHCICVADHTEETVVKLYYPTSGLALIKQVVFPSSVLVVTLVVPVAQSGSKHILYSSSFYHFEKIIKTVEK